MSKSKEHIHLRFQAVVIASQLPDNRAEALLVLDYARDMVVEFLDDSSEVSDSVSGTIVRDRFSRPVIHGVPGRRRFGGQRRDAAALASGRYQPSCQAGCQEQTLSCWL